MIVAREEQHAEHLRMLSQLSQILKPAGYLDALLTAPEGWSLQALLVGKNS